MLSQRAVEKHINSIFAKLELTPDDSVDRRVKAVLMFLDDGGSAERVLRAIDEGGVYTMVLGESARHDGTVADERVRVWVVDDQASFRRATAATLDAMDDFVMAGECETGETAVELIRDGDATSC